MKSKKLMFKYRVNILYNSLIMLKFNSLFIKLIHWYKINKLIKIELLF